MAEKDGNDLQKIVEYPPKEFKVEDDYQLKRAIEILKTGTHKKLLAATKG